MKSLRISTSILFILFSTGAAVDAQCIPASTAAGAYDTCFDGDGRLTTDVTPNADFPRAVVVQPDGKIVVAGVAYSNETAGADDFTVVRYNIDGSLDTTFDGDGIVITDFGSEAADQDSPSSVALQADGKIVVFGSAAVSGINVYGFVLARYNTDGSLDTTFDGDGKAQFTTSNVYMEGNGMVIQPDGKIVGVGRLRAVDHTTVSIVVRFNTNGSLDTSFNSVGFVSGPLLGANAVAMQADRITFVGPNGNLDTYGVAQLNPNGSLNMFFGTGGVATYDAGVADSAATIGIRFADIFVGGSAWASGVERYASVVRFRPDGGSTISFVQLNDSEFTEMAFQPDLKVLTAGSSLSPAWGFTIRRHNEVFPDTTFPAVQVKFLPDATPQGVGVGGIAMTRDNKIVAVGSAGETMPPTISRFGVVRLMSGLQAPHAERFDFDGDRKADVSVFRPSENRWYVFRSSDFGVTEQFYGINGDRPVPADYDGDGKTDFALFQNGSWKYFSSATGSEAGTFWGSSGDIPRVSDFNGDGRADFILFRPGQSIWFRSSITGEFNNQSFGLSGDKPVAGDFDGDGKSDKAIFRPSTGDWWYQSSINNAQLAVHWGISTDIPAAGDYDGDGKTDFAVYRPETGVWYIINSSNFSFTILNFGLAEDKPVPADYDGDGKVDIAVFRPSTGVWYLLRSTAGFGAMQFGVSTDVPVPNVYIQ